MSEIWKDVAGYEGYYRVSNYGRVKSLKSKTKNADNVLSAARGTGGYLFVTLRKSGNQKHFDIHRLVANAFIPNPENFPQVNHKNGIKGDNLTNNLEWVTQSGNIKHAYSMGLMENTRAALRKKSKTPEGRRQLDVLHKSKQKAVFAICVREGNIKRFASAREASKELKINRHIVRRVAQELQLYAGEWLFAYEDTSGERIKNRLKEAAEEMNREKIILINIKTQEEVRFKNQTEAALHLGVTATAVNNAINGRRPTVRGCYARKI